MIRYCEADESLQLTRSNASQPTNAYSNTPIMINENTATVHPNESHLHVAAIDNGLAFPFKHPDQWRSYPYAWLSLPHALLVQPISIETRKKLLPMLSDPEWWKDTVRDLHRLFSLDSDFEPRMFERQLAVLKGQGWNIMQTLLDPSAGILDLVTRKRCVIWEDELVIEWDQQILSARGDTATPLEIPTERPNSDGDMEVKSPRSPDDGDHDPHSDPEIGPTTVSRDMDEHANADDVEPSQSSWTAESEAPRKRWNDRLRRSFSLDRVSKRGKPSRRSDPNVNPALRKSYITVERIEIVETNNPYFTWC